MPHAGQEIHGPDGFRLRLVRTAADTGGEVLEMEATYGGAGGLPPEHLHPGQVERFEVLEGRMLTVIGGAERRYESGETFEVPAGRPHQMAAEGPARMRWEVRPALRTAEFFERLHGDGPDSARAAPSIAAFLAEFADEIQITTADPRVPPPERNLEIVRSVLDGFGSGDVDGALAHFDPDVEMDWSRRLLDPTVVHGHEGVRETIEGMRELFAEIRFDADELRDLGDVVLYVGTAHFTGRGSGVGVAANAAILWTIRDDRIVSFRFFQSREDALAFHSSQ